jgi:cyclase
LLVRKKGLVKTCNFKSGKYVGDPINAVRIFNEKEVDELIVLDIDATVERRDPDYKMIEDLAAECRMPLCYGGGVSSAAVQSPRFVSELAERVGTQSVVVILDVEKTGREGKYQIVTHNAREKTPRCPVQFSREVAQLGCGEIVINSVDRDGMMNGYDFELMASIRAAVGVPLTALGGAGTLRDIGSLIQKFGIIGASAGSLFVFKGAFKAVLINYPSRVEKDALVRENFPGIK